MEFAFLMCRLTNRIQRVCFGDAARCQFIFNSGHPTAVTTF